MDRVMHIERFKTRAEAEAALERLLAAGTLDKKRDRPKIEVFRFLTMTGNKKEYCISTKRAPKVHTVDDLKNALATFAKNNPGEGEIK